MMVDIDARMLHSLPHIQTPCSQALLGIRSESASTYDSLATVSFAVYLYDVPNTAMYRIRNENSCSD
jgi:hypothetical protein